MTKKEAGEQVKNLTKLLPFLSDNIEVIFDIIELTNKHKKLFEAYEGNALKRVYGYLMEKIVHDKNPAIGMFTVNHGENNAEKNDFGNL